MQRTKSLTTRYYRWYKISLIALVGGLLLFYNIHWILSGEFLGLVWVALYAFVIVRYWYPGLVKSLRQMKNIAYDRRNLYILENGQEEQIPFHEIKEVEIISLDGIYKFHFFDKNLHGGAVTCKTSMWYPLNYPKVDKELNRVRDLIRAARKEYYAQNDGQKELSSYHS
jgi:hypothetical protein